MPFTTSYTDRHLAIADSVRDFLLTALPPPATLSRAYDPDVIYGNWSGRTVWVFPTTEVDARRLTRWKVQTDYSLNVVVAERYIPAALADPGEVIPPDWVDANCLWVRNAVYGPLNDLVKLGERLIPTAIPQTCTLKAKYDPMRLTDKVFFSVVEVSFREERRG